MESTPLLQPVTTAYTAFRSHQKLIIVVTAALASVFSPLSANIYFPALQSIKKDLDVTENMLNLTITSYMVRIYYPQWTSTGQLTH